MFLGAVMAENLLAEAEEEFSTKENRFEHRSNGRASVQKSADYEFLRQTLPADLIPKGPDIFNEKMSKRTYEKQMQAWRRHLYCLRSNFAHGRTCENYIFVRTFMPHHMPELPDLKNKKSIGMQAFNEQMLAWRTQLESLRSACG